MKKWIALGVLIAASGIVLAVMLTRKHEPRVDNVVEDFRSTERTAIAAFNNGLRRQRANEIDETELSVAIERDVLEPWRSMRARVAAAPIPSGRDELYAVMRRYIEERQTAWQAYALALRAGSEVAAQPLYATYHEQNARAQQDAQVLGGLLRK